MSRSPGAGRCSRDEDLDIVTAEGVRHIICLQEAHELRRLEPPETMRQRQQAVESRGMQFTHAPIEDFHAPSLELAISLVRQIRGDLSAGQRVLVHCQAGLGRAGTITACMLVCQGLSAHGAIAMARWVRPGAVQSEAQEQLVGRFESHIKHHNGALS